MQIVYVASAIALWAIWVGLPVFALAGRMDSKKDIRGWAFVPYIGFAVLLRLVGVSGWLFLALFVPIVGWWFFARAWVGACEVTGQSRAKGWLVLIPLVTLAAIWWIVVGAPRGRQQAI